MRFADRHKMDMHLDWHFVQNRKDKERTRKAMSRGWHPTKEEWVSAVEITDKTAIPFPFGDGAEQEEKKEEVVSVQADENQTQCPKCGESFEQYYDPELDEWMYRDCVSVEGTIYHLKCSKSVAEVKKLEQTPVQTEIVTETLHTSMIDTIKQAPDMPPLEDHDSLAKKRQLSEDSQLEEAKRPRQDADPVT